MSAEIAMINCPNCGAGNKPGSATCRMCATSLAGIVEATAAPVSHADPESHRQTEATQAEPQGIVCPECGTMNEPGWSFCQQCGKRLPQAQPQPVARPPAPQPPAESAAQDGLRTNPEQQAAVEPGVRQGLTTVAEPKPDEQSYKTVVAQQPPDEQSYKTVVAQQLPLEHQFKTVAEESPAAQPEAVPKHPLPAAPPTVIAEAPAAPPPVSVPDSSELPTVEVQPPSIEHRPVAPTPSVSQPSAPLPVAATPPATPPATMTERPQSMSGVLCNQCGQTSNVGSAFCANCGAPITFGKTMVMSSHLAPVQGRLHLVMEGGQPGEVYELGDETVIGRSNGEITFPHDGFMSGRHARIQRQGNHFILSDEGSRNGTFVKIIGNVELKPGDMILVGKQLFRFEA